MNEDRGLDPLTWIHRIAGRALAAPKPREGVEVALTEALRLGLDRGREEGAAVAFGLEAGRDEGTDNEWCGSCRY